MLHWVLRIILKISLRNRRDEVLISGGAKGKGCAPGFWEVERLVTLPQGVQRILCAAGGVEADEE